MERKKKRSDEVVKSGLDNFVKSAPDETKSDKKMLKRESKTFRINEDLWLDYDYWCKKNKITRSDQLEGFILSEMGKKKEQYL